jgi:proteasome lid subunit RPN8/RPN11
MIAKIASGVAEQLLAHAASEAPREACGLLLGRREPLSINSAVPARNVATRPETSFEIDPATLLSQHRAARGEGLEVVGHYHSHPNASPEPSHRDAARASENGQLWLIIAGGAVHGWQAVAKGCVEGRFTAVALEAG